MPRIETMSEFQTVQMLGGPRVHFVGIGRRLRQLDDDVLPTSGRVRYDQRRPLWLAYGSVVGSFSGTGLVVAAERMAGPARIAVCTGIAVLLAVYLVAARRWERAHRLREGERGLWLQPFRDRVAVACGCVWLIYSLGTNLADDHDWVGVVPAILVGVLITIAVYGVRRHRERRRSTRQRDT